MDAAQLAALGAIAGLIVAGITVISFWAAFSDRITKAHAAAEEAARCCTSLKEGLNEARTSTVALSATFSLYRVQVAEDYVRRETLREMEERLGDQLAGVTDRLDRLAVSWSPPQTQQGGQRGR